MTDYVFLNKEFDKFAEAMDRQLKNMLNSGNPVEELEAKLDLVKDVIQVKLDRNKEHQANAAKASEKAILEGLLAQKQAQALANMSEEEIRKRLAEL